VSSAPSESPRHTRPACEVLEELGGGATGQVWRARLLQPVAFPGSRERLEAGTEVALKRLRPEAARDPLQREAFELESRLTRQLRHRGLVRGLDAGEDELGHWLLLEFLPGPTLREALEEAHSLSEARVRAVGARLCAALEALHNAGYLHGDLKPENVRLDKANEAVLIDLGFCLPVDARPEQRVTGSLAYLSPEELRGGAADAASEVYSLGILLYELVVGQHPFAGVSRAEADAGRVEALANATFSLPSLRHPSLSPFIDRLLEAMLEPVSEERPGLSAVAQIFADGETSDWWRERLATPLRESTASPYLYAHQALPLMGREAELERLSELAHAVFAAPIAEDAPGGPGGLVELVGSGGSGKSRLMREFAARARMTTRPPLYLRGRCSRFEEQRPCQPWITLLSRFLNLHGGEVPGPREGEELEKLLPTSERQTLLEALDPLGHGITPAAVPAALCTWLTGLARRGPVLVFLDDLSFADEGTLDVLARLVPELEDLPLLIVIGRDAEEQPRRPDAHRRLGERLRLGATTTELVLPPLTPEALEDLTRRLFTRTSPQLRLARVLWERSRGNPGLVTELVRGLVDRGDAVPAAGGLELRIHPDDLALPASLHGEILRAYARLERRDRAWLERLSVSGGRIEPRLLLRAWPEEEAEDLKESLTRLTRSGWLRPEGERHRFRRPALRAAVYKRLTPEDRRRQHDAVARALRPERGGRQSLGDAFQRAFHLRAAGRYEELLTLLRPLLLRLRDRGQPARVYSLGLWGLEAIAQLPPAEDSTHLALEILWAATDAADRLGYREKQRRLLDQMAELEIDTERDPESAGRVYMMYARHGISVGHYGPARGMLANALVAFRAAGHDGLASDALRRLAAVHAHTGDLTQAGKLAREARELAPDDFLIARAEHLLGVIDQLEGRFDSALRRSDRCLILLRRLDLFEVLAVRALAHSLRARVYRAAGRPRRGLVAARHALRFARRAGDRRLETELQARLGSHLLDVDRVEEAEKLLRDALLVSTEIEDRHDEAVAALFLGILLGEQGDPGGSAQLARCVRVASRMGLTRIEAVCTAIQARIAFQRDPRAALELSTRAEDLLARADVELIDRIVIRGTHAMILSALGREAESEQLVERLRRRMRAANGRIESALLQRRQRMAAGQLLKAALTPEGPVYRRVRLDGV
jgi:tetratricopeptide (TPR) repeat protein